MAILDRRFDTKLNMVTDLATQWPFIISTLDEIERFNCLPYLSYISLLSETYLSLSTKYTVLAYRLLLAFFVTGIASSCHALRPSCIVLDNILIW